MKRRLWHGRINRAIRDLQELLDDLTRDGEIEDLSIARLHSLGAQLLTYVASNRGAIINYGKRHRAGLREGAVNSIVGKRMAKRQQMRGSIRGAHMLMQVRTAHVNGELRDRLRAEFRILIGLRIALRGRSTAAAVHHTEHPLCCTSYLIWQMLDGGAAERVVPASEIP